jgi:hypothetical protein
LGVAAQVKQPFKKGKLLPEVGEFARITDPVTENVIVRLTSLGSMSLLPFARNRFISTRERLLIFSSDRTGHFAPFQIDLHTAAIRQIAATEKLNPRSLCFDRQEKSVRYLDGDSLFEAALAHGSPRRIGDGFTAFSGTSDGTLYLISGRKLVRGEGNDVRNARTLAEDADDAWAQPNAAGCLFSRSTGPDERELHYVQGNGSAKPSLVAKGRVRDPFWDVDGESVLYLRDVTASNGTVLAEIHGRTIRTGEEYLVSPTSQFACFAPNSDASVFVGASRSRAQPNIVIMLRSPQREMTLCEHRATHPGDVTPVFSPDNRRIFFESDHEGRSAIYSVNVELLVEPQL